MNTRFLLFLTILLFPVLGNSQIREVNSDHWVATDELGRKLADASEMGPVKDEKVVGMFYWSWHTDGNAKWVMPDGSVANITEILEQYPEAVRDKDHAAWQNTPNGGVFWWDEPLFGYYRTTDPWILRKHAEMLADAGVDVVFFDCTNGSFTWKSSYQVLLEVWHQARLDGVEAPQVAFLLPFSPTDGALDQLHELYTELYKPGLYQDQWFMWEGKPLIMAYPEALKTRAGETAAMKFTATQAFYAINATCPSWDDNKGSLTFKLFTWNNSYAESVNAAPVAEKRIVDFNDNEKIQLTFDELPAGEYIWELSEGTDVVGVWKWTDSNDPVTSYFGGALVSGNYESEISYDPAISFSPLSNGTNHVPVEIGAAPINQQLVDEIKSFFTYRPGQPDYVNGPSRNDHWGWLEASPQHGYGPKAEGGFEMSTVGVAQNASDASGGHASGFNKTGTYGRSYTRSEGQNPDPDAYLKGLNFQEQWDGVFDIDPDLIFITGWNEWIGGRHFNWDVQPFAFVDIYNAEKSRDIEPAKSWGSKGDVYYMQLINNVRKFKGMQKPDKVSSLKTIDLEDTGSWTGVMPEYLSYKGNTLHRDHPGQGPELVYTNNTGRNDIIAAKVARDETFVYFYVETDSVLTDKSDPGWMRLYIDLDRDKATGWEGYDFIINRSSPTDSVLVEKSTSGWEWAPAGKAEYTVNEKSLVMKIEFSILGLDSGERLNFEFKWSDNMQEDGNIMDFYVNGDVAPGARFNYVYTVDWTGDGYHFATKAKGTNQGLKCEQFAGSFDSIPLFNELKATTTYYLPRIEIPEPSPVDMALKYTGFIDVPEKDEYTFSLDTDLSARAYIDGIRVVASESGQGEQTGAMKLMPGKHLLRIEYITKDGNTPSLSLLMESSTLSKSVIHDTMLYKYNVLPEIELTFKDEQNYYSEIDTVALVKGIDADGQVEILRIYDNEELFIEQSSPEFVLKDMEVGDHSVLARVVDNDGAVMESNRLVFEVSPPFAVPGTIPAKEFRKGENVVVIESDDFDGGFSIRASYGAADYPIQVDEPGWYQFTFRVPSSNRSGITKITLNGQEISSVDLGNTGDDQPWHNVVTEIALSSGIQILGFEFGGLITLHKVDISKATVINSKEKNILQTYPNPSSNEFLIRSQQPVSDLVVYDLLGNVADRTAQKKSRFVSSIGADLKPGMYVLVVTGQDGSKQSLKLIKK
ncbi:MAG: T9SS type A sorting domain-containing protein [Bacteroidetes bacterium]|nr:T9SS type A sorting domain-containing protein [Bacteroidota bacterium]